VGAVESLMNGQRVEITPLGGVSESIPQKPSDASRITNFTVDKRTNGWDSRVGYEKYDPRPGNLWRPFDSMGRIDSLFIWSKHQGAQDWTVFESGGTLYWLDSSSNTGDMRAHVIDSGRVIPAPSEPVTTYTPFGRFLIVTNGHDRPIKYSAWPVWMSGGSPISVPSYTLGWSEIPPQPTVWGVETQVNFGSSGQHVGMWTENTLDAGIPARDDIQEAGLGSASVDVENTYKYKVSWVNNAGAESPLSSSSNVVSWDSPSAGGTYTGSRFITKVEIPVGPSGTTARRLYRTLNMKGGDPTIPENYYFCVEVGNNYDEHVFDHVGDQALGSLAPGLTDSVVFPASAARFTAVFKGCLFLDGGTSNGTKIYWSKPGKPDEFDVLNFMDVGMRDAGEITGFYAHYNFLIVLRERGIDVVRGTYGSFDVTPISQTVGTRSKDSVTTIPDLGVVFLAQDGVYIMTGNMDAGGNIDFRKISTPINKTIKRMNIDTSARAVAAYSQKWREWHCYFPADGSDRPSIVVVLHLDMLGGNTTPWSVREDVPVGSLTTTIDGDLVFGHHTGSAGPGDPVESGLFVISNRRACGGQYQLVGQDEVVVDNAPCTSVYQSSWLDFGDRSARRRVNYVYLLCLTMGDNQISLTHYKDRGPDGTQTVGMKLQRPDHIDQKVFDSAVVGEDPWDESMLTQIRFPIDQGVCSEFKYGIETINDLVILGWAIEFTPSGGTKVISGKRA